MAYQRSMTQGELVRLFYSPDRPEAGAQLTLYANAMGSSGEPLSEGTLVVQALSPSGKPKSIRLSPSDEEWGLFTGTFVPEEYGDYQLKLTCRENRAELETTLSVRGFGRERIGQPARRDVMEEIATITRGKTIDLDDIGGLTDELAALPEPTPETRRLRIWCHPAWTLTIVSLFGLFWTGRKFLGMV